MLGAGEDAAAVYFVANGVLSAQALAAHAPLGHCRHDPAAGVPPGTTCNLYVERYDSQPGQEGWQPPTFIAALSHEDERDWQALNGPKPGAGYYTSQGRLSVRVSPDGQFLAFMSDQSLTGYDNRASAPAAHDAPAEEVYLYDSGTEGVVCASCEPSGARPVGVFDPTAEEVLEHGEMLVDPSGDWAGRWLAGSLPEWAGFNGFNSQALYQSRYLSDAGRLFFDSPEALVPQDTNAKEDVYEYEPQGVPQGSHQCTSSLTTFSPSQGGCVGLISSGTSTSESAFLDASESGGEGEHGETLSEGAGEVFFLTAARLSAQDTDEAFDVYDAHECAGACPPPPPGESESFCESSETCRPGSSQAAVGASPASASPAGQGNLSAQQKVLASKTTSKPKPLTRAQKLTRALKQCRVRHRHSRHKRAACEKAARKRYGPLKKAAKKAGRPPARHATPARRSTR